MVLQGIPELIEAALEAKRRGWEPLYLPLGAKNPGRARWQEERLTDDQIRATFVRSGNLGLLTGEPSGGLTDVDLDAMEALACAENYLPPTEMVHGRPSKPNSHWWYVSSPVPRLTQWRDIDGTMLVEMRGTGGQTLVPPSVHPEGETLAWTHPGDPAQVDLITLQTACARIAATSLVARHWPDKGSRHHAALAVGGFLLRGGLEVELVARLVESAARVAGDEEWQSRGRDVRDTARNLDLEKSVTGLPTLTSLLRDGERIAAKLRDWLSLNPSKRSSQIWAAHCSSTDRPVIQVNGRFMREITGDALAALQQANDPPRFFQRGSELVMLAAEGLAADPLTTASLKGQLDRSADFMTIKFDKDGEEESRSPARPPDDVVKDILALKQFPFPVLNRFASTPVFLPNGTLLASQGYHAASGIYLQLDGLKHLRWDMPLEEAKGLLLDELLVDFPFADDASRAHTVAALLLPYVRPMILGPTPLHLIDAPARGTGKGLLVDVISIVTTGEVPYVMALPKDEDELGKRITATLLRGYSLILLDNVMALHSSNLSAVLTATKWRGRLLGKSQMVDVPNTATWLATGNNVVLSDEMNRRTVVTRLDTGVEAPEERTGFRHRLPQWAMEHRSELVSACLSIINIWIQTGMPRGEATLGRFEEWAEVMDGICGVSGVYGLLGNRDLQKSKDPESQEWAALCATWYSTHGSKPVGAREVLAIARSASVLLELWVRRTDLAALQRVGHALSARRDRVFGGYQLGYAGTNSRSGSAEYFLHRQKMTPDKNPRNPANPATQARDKVGSVPGFGPETPQNPAGVSDVNCRISGVSGVLQPPEYPDVLELD